MDYTNKGFEDKIPKDSQEVEDYFRQIKKANMPKDYYVQININNVEDIALNLYMEDNVNFLAIEFKTPTGEIDKNGNEIKRKERLIIAKNPGRIGDLPRY